MPDAEYIVFWKDSAGQQVHTVVDAHNLPVHRDREYLDTHSIVVLDDESAVLEALEAADGSKYAVVPALARKTLGWDV